MARAELTPAALPAPLTKVGRAVEVVEDAVEVVVAWLGVMVVTTTVVHVEVLPFEVTVVMHVLVVVVGLATQMLCRHSQAYG
jgi:hypothetical protein